MDIGTIGQRTMINGYASIYGHLGYNVHARKFFQALNRLTPVCLTPLYPNFIDFKVDRDILDMIQRQESIRLSDPAICIGYGDELHKFNGSPLIGYTVFEYTVLPRSWVNLLNQMDQVWTTSTWGRRVLIDNHIPQERLAVVPEGIDPEIYKQKERPRNARFTFLSIGKWEERKGQKILLQAYAEAFKGMTDVELHVLWQNPILRNFSLEGEISKLGIDSCPPIKLLDPVPTSRRMAELYNSADCFVLPTRAEGWGLPIIEAMACGLPVITTGYSAITDYANSDNSYLINSKDMIDVHDPVFLPNKGERGVWADPDPEHLKELMLHVYNNRDKARQKGMVASNDIRTNWTWDNAARKACDLLNIEH